MRELIAAFTSPATTARFERSITPQLRRNLLGSEELVWGVLRDLETSALPEKEKALFRFVAKVNHESPKITAGRHEAALHAAGWTDEAIYYAITVCALFNFYNRWIDAAGVHAMSEEAHRSVSERGRQSTDIRASKPALKAKMCLGRGATLFCSSSAQSSWSGASGEVHDGPSTAGSGIFSPETALNQFAS